MAVPVVNIVIEKETDFSTRFKLKNEGSPLNLEGYTFSSKIRKHYSSPTYYEFSVSPYDPPTSGIILVGMASSITSIIPMGRYVYDILVTISGETKKVMEGNVLVKGTAS